MKRPWILLFLLAAMSYAHPANAQRAYFNGGIQSNKTLCPVTSNEVTVVNTQAGYFTDPGEPYPKTGDLAYVHALATNVAPCVADAVGFQFFLPEGAVLAISASNPVYCMRGRLDGSFWEYVPNDANGGCSQTPSAGTYGGYYFGWSGLAPAWWYEVRVPVVFYKKLDGLAGPTTHRLTVATQSTYGDLFPYQPVTVFYQATFQSYASSAITSNSATVGLTLTNYYRDGLLYIDYGTTAAFGSTSASTSVPNTALSTPISRALAGLNPSTLYHWRARFVSTAGTFTSATQSFTTSGAAVQVGSLSVTLGGLPAGTQVTLGITGPGGFNLSPTLMTGTGVNYSDVATGTYTVTAPTTPAGGQIYVPNAVSQSATVTSGATATINVVYSAAAAAVANDFNADGKPDLLWRNPNTGQNVVWYISNASQIGQSLLESVADPQWQLAASGDFNADNRPDLVWRNESTGQNVVWFMNGATRVSQTILPQVADNAWHIVAAADFNADNKPDLLWRNGTTGANVVWFMNGAAFTSQAVLSTVDTAWRLGGAGDFNSDGRPDLLWRNTTTGMNVVWFMNGTTFTSQAVLPPVADTAWYVAGVDDYYTNGKADIMWRNASSGQNVVWIMDGVTFASQSLLPAVAETNWTTAGYHPSPAKAPADFNGDGQPDLLWHNVSTGATVVWYMSGTTFTSQAALPPVPDINWQVVGIGDFSGDRKPDVVWRNAATGQNVVWIMNGATFVSQTVLPAVADTNWQIAGAADFNGDGNADIVWRNRVTGVNVVWIMNGATFVSQTVLPAVADTAWKIMAAGDLDGNGKTDLVWRNTASGQNVVWFMDGTTFLSQAFLPPVADTNWQIGWSADFNGDGRADLVWRNSVSGQNVVWLMNGATFLSQTMLPAVADPAWMIVRDRR